MVPCREIIIPGLFIKTCLWFAQHCDNVGHEILSKYLHFCSQIYTIFWYLLHCWADLQEPSLLAYTKFWCRCRLRPKGVLEIRRIFSLVDMITNTKFSNCPNVFKIGVVQQYNMHSKQQNIFQRDSPFTIPRKHALSTPSFYVFILGVV